MAARKSLPRTVSLTLLSALAALRASLHIHIEDWPVQILPAAGPLEEGAVIQAVETEVEGTRVCVMRAEHLVAIALALGRAKDFSRILQFIEAGVLEAANYDEVLARRGLLAKWEAFGQRFLRDETL